MAFTDDVGVGEIRIRMSDAGPGSAAVQLRLSDAPECVALADGVLRWGVWRGHGGWNDNLRTDFEETGIAKTGIQREQLLPATSVAEESGGELPE